MQMVTDNTATKKRNAPAAETIVDHTGDYRIMTRNVFCGCGRQMRPHDFMIDQACGVVLEIRFLCDACPDGEIRIEPTKDLSDAN
jgi:hypothetical protein